MSRHHLTSLWFGLAILHVGNGWDVASITFPQRDVCVSMVDRGDPEGAAAPLSPTPGVSGEPGGKEGRP